MKNIYHKIILSALIAACAVLLTCGDDNENEHRGMVWIPPGTFMMGSPDGSGGINGTVAELNRSLDETLHQVTLTQGFWMSRYLITQEQFFSIMRNKPANFVSGNRRPADGLNWYEAIVFCNRLSIKEGLNFVYSIDGSTNPDDWGTIPTTSNATWNAVIMLGSYPDVPNGYRLPTEAEWEYACRAGKTTAYNTGDSINTSQANYDGSSDSPPGDYKGSSTPVGSYAPNAWGLYDMYGNMHEWCWDWYGNYSSVPVDNPICPSGSTRILRGGAWDSFAPHLRSAYRYDHNPDDQYSILGFRVVCQ